MFSRRPPSAKPLRDVYQEGVLLTQIAAIQAALDKVALGLLDDHARHCVIEGHGEGEPAELTDELMAAVARLMRRG